MHLRAQCHAKWPKGCTEFEQPVWFKLTSTDSLQLALTNKPWVIIDLEKRKCDMTSNISQPWSIFFLHPRLSFLDCSSWIWGQTLWIRIIHSKPSVDTCYCIQRRLELKYFHFPQFLLNARWADHSPWANHSPQKSENWELEIKGRSLRSSYGW